MIVQIYGWERRYTDLYAWPGLATGFWQRAGPTGTSHIVGRNKQNFWRAKNADEIKTNERWEYGE